MTALLLALSAAVPASAGDVEDCGKADSLLKTQPARAVAACRRLAEQGNAAAQLALGVMYGEGQGVPPDGVQAGKWVRKAAEQGYAPAEERLGAMYSTGYWGVPRNPSEAVSWTRKAADQGWAMAQHNLAVYYDEGFGVPRDDTEAVKWYRKAAEQGDVSSQNNLGVMYCTGEGVAEDRVLGYMWFNLAASRMPPGPAKDRAARARDHVASEMTPDQVEKARQLSAEWLTAHPILPPVQEVPPPLAEQGLSGAPASSATSRDRDGLGYVTARCPGTTFITVCNGPNCEHGTTKVSISAPGYTFEADVKKGSGYCTSCLRQPDLADCQKEYLPLR
ncbi:MAG: tetratricopeptide repeat protein [Dongiaceae bacterium]